jgi:hypothetical protein
MNKRRPVGRSEFAPSIFLNVELWGRAAPRPLKIKGIT